MNGNISMFVDEVSVINKHGNIFKIDDIIKPVEIYEDSYIKKAKIARFQFINETLYAITDNAFLIDINCIELDIPPKFVLPEKWCIKNTSVIIGNWFNDKAATGQFQTYTSRDHMNRYLHSHNGNNQPISKTVPKSFSNHFKRPDFTELTLEQFTQYVANE